MERDGLWIVPNPDGSGRYCVYDSVAGTYLLGAINVSLREAKAVVGSTATVGWRDLARAAGWVPPEELAEQLESVTELVNEATKSKEADHGTSDDSESDPAATRDGLSGSTDL